MKFILEISADNAAFKASPNHETARILRRLADKLERDRHDDRGRLFDVNGNQIGGFEYSREAPVCGF